MQVDATSLAWREVRDWAQARIATEHDRLEGDIDATETAKARGAIAVLREMLAAGDPASFGGSVTTGSTGVTSY